MAMVHVIAIALRTASSLNLFDVVITRNRRRAARVAFLDVGVVLGEYCIGGLHVCFQLDLSALTNKCYVILEFEKHDGSFQYGYLRLYGKPSVSTPQADDEGYTPTQFRRHQRLRCSSGTAAQLVRALCAEEAAKKGGAT